VHNYKIGAGVKHNSDKSTILETRIQNKPRGLGLYTEQFRTY